FSWWKQESGSTRLDQLADPAEIRGDHGCPPSERLQDNQPERFVPLRRKEQGDCSPHELAHFNSRTRAQPLNVRRAECRVLNHASQRTVADDFQAPATKPLRGVQ